MSATLKDYSSFFSSCLPVASSVLPSLRVLSIRCICFFLDLPGSDLCSQGYPQLVLPNFKRCLIPLPASLDFLPRASPLKRLNQGETGHYWPLAPMFSSFSTTGAFLLEWRSVEQRPFYKPTVSSGCVIRATARVVLEQEPLVSMVA